MQGLRRGMFADVNVAADGGVETLLIPRTAIQNVGDQTVVYVADSQQPGRFIEREVRLGDRSGNDVGVLSGVKRGERVVADGSFAVRAERDRLGLHGTKPPAGTTPRTGPSQPAAAPERQGGKVQVTETGYEPARLTLRAGAPAMITFVRTTDKTCGTEVVFPSLNIRPWLPLNDPALTEDAAPCPSVD